MNHATDIAVSMQHVDVLFGNARQQAQALQLLDAGQTREEILEQSGAVLGVANASLEVPTGSISVLMGLSGSGKSSLLRCVNGLNTVTRGTLEVSTRAGVVNVSTCTGKSLRTLRRNSLAMVFQQFALLPWATVRENIGFGLSVRGESRQDIQRSVDQQLELVGLEAWADKPIHTLSGGMQQRVGLARAFATDADILLMDEPFSALDPLIREHLQDELLTLQSRLKKTILFVSHDLDEALKLGNQISIMDGGRIVQTGTADDIVFSPENDYVSRFVANINPLSVLSAMAVMQPLEQDGDDFRHAESDILVRWNGDGVPQLVLSGETVTVQPREADGDHPQSRMASEPASTSQRPSGSLAGSHDVHVAHSVSPGTPIRELLQLAASSSRPILVQDGDGRPCGLIRHQDLFTALQRS
ncbi:quaternary amine ABC transporter ATP-binding protein [Granulosicoccus sp. 3-233]|uniref:quaternary amine ABC transporter ATP-binding protein n=1 Tax=Granulosicoccus sp. 3-233 TaxID=3417969 RepID=UPI003D348824